MVGFADWIEESCVGGKGFPGGDLSGRKDGPPLAGYEVDGNSAGVSAGGQRLDGHGLGASGVSGATRGKDGSAA